MTVQLDFNLCKAKKGFNKTDGEGNQIDSSLG